MPWYAPPPDPPGHPVLVEVPGGTACYRIHDGRFGATQPNFTRAAGPFVGGRFDSFDASYGYVYAASLLDATVDEAVLRDEPFEASGVRPLPRRRLAGKVLSGFSTTGPMDMVDLVTVEGLAAVGQDYWLTMCDSDQYTSTRIWAATVRGWAPLASGFAYRPRHNLEAVAWVFFDDADPASPRPDAAPLLGPAQSTPIDSGPGLLRVEGALRRRGVRLTP